MRTWLAGLLLAALSAGSVVAGTPKEFVVTGYKLAFVNVDKDGAITNEYVPRGQTLENWKTLIGVRVWPKIDDLKEVTAQYIRQLEPVMVREAKVFEPEGSKPGTDVVFELYLAPADKSYLEYNLIRFVKESGTPGVKSYQFAERRAYDVDAAVKVYEQRRETWLGAIAGLMLTAETETVAVTTAETLGSESADEDEADEEEEQAEDADADEEEAESEELDDEDEDDAEDDEDEVADGDDDGEDDDDADEDDDEDEDEEEEDEDEDDGDDDE